MQPQQPLIPFSFSHGIYPNPSFFQKPSNYIFSIYRIKIEVDHVIQPQPQPHHLSIVSQINQSKSLHLSDLPKNINGVINLLFKCKNRKKKAQVEKYQWTIFLFN